MQMHARLCSKLATSHLSFKLRLENAVHRLLKPSLRGIVKAPYAYLNIINIWSAVRIRRLTYNHHFPAEDVSKAISKMHTFMGNKIKEKATNWPPFLFPRYDLNLS